MVMLSATSKGIEPAWRKRTELSIKRHNQSSKIRLYTLAKPANTKTKNKDSIFKQERAKAQT